MKNLPHLLIALALLPGCESKEDFVPSTDSKSDATDTVPRPEHISFGAETSEEFTRALDHHGYTFSAAAGTDAIVEVTHLGSASALDTALFVFGPSRGNGFFGDEAIAFDDDGGFGKLSKVSVPIAEAGTYLAVLRPAGNSRGHYRLTLGCKSEPCLAAPSTPTVSWPQAVTNFAEMAIDLECDTTNFSFSLFDLQIEEERETNGTLVQTFYSAEIAVGAAFSGSAFISVFVPAGGDPELEFLDCPRP